ncbi:MAG: hypothetical protein WAV07_16210 [Candidatus Contendobacter sp.]
MKLIFALVGMLLAVVATAADTLNPTVLNGHSPDQYTGWDFTLSGKGSPWFAYYGADNTLYVRRPDGAEVGLGATDRPRQQSGLAMTPVGDGVAVLWRDKLPQKHLYLIPKLDPAGVPPPPVVVAGEESDPLTRLKLERAGEVEYLLWLGEKGDPATKEQYHLYFRTVEQDGKVLSPVERVMPGRYPAWIIDQDVIPVFSWMVHEGKLAMTLRVFDRAKKSFGPLTKIADAPPITPIFEAFKSGDRWFLLWLGQYDNDAKMLLEGLYSDDKGQTWKRFALDELRGLDIGGLSIATDHKGHILIALDGNRRLIDPDDSKDNVYLVRSTDNGATWQKPQTVRDDDLRLTRAEYPVLALGAQPGTVMLAWEDWRGIRPNVYVSYSKDYGATWEPALPLGRPGVWNLGLNARPRLLLNRDDRFWLVARQYKDDTLELGQRDYVLYPFTWDEVRRNAEGFRISEIQARATEVRLRERVTQYWQAMQDGQYETAYALTDPFFRHKRDLKTYLSSTGAIKYHRYQVGPIVQKGNLARVQMEFESEVPEFKLPNGKIVSQPRKTMTLLETWVFVNDNWYREYYDEMAEKSSTSY